MLATASFPSIPGYQFGKQLYSSSRTAVYQAIHEIEQRPVVLKVMQRDYPSFAELVQFRNQYTITQNILSPGIVRPLKLETWQNGYVLVMADQGGISLRQYMQEQSLDLTAVLTIAHQLADILHNLGQCRIVHKDIKPANILIHPQTQDIQLIDFSLASLLPKETQTLQNPTVLAGTLAYLAPEQTGRMNRGIDYRTDFYALGVTLYELLTDVLPFAAAEPMELVHCHLAKMPVPPCDVATRFPIPPALSNIVLKLMAKNAEDRYQSAVGLKFDLDQCLQQWREFGTMTTFDLGQRDICDRFLIPEKLYGRAAEVQVLLDAYERVSRQQSELLLVAGFSGVGKTAVIHEVHKPITRQHGYFIKGKFDQLNRNVPFSAFVQAFRSLVAQLLGESDAQLARWKRNILAAVGESGQVLLDVIPELVHIMGQQPAVPELTGSAAQNRFNLLFSKFVQVFTTTENPLVLFLDDLQWADAASLKLLKLLMNETESGHLLVLGAYRDNEVFAAHPLMLTLEEIRQIGISPQTLTLTPLGQADITQLVADTLRCSCAQATPLAQLMYEKTRGNPFFTTQFLQGLYKEGCLVFNPDSRGWQCDLTQIRQLALTDDVVEFMVGQLRKLPTQAQEVIKLAACIGNRFELATLATVKGSDPDAVAIELWAALQEGLLIPESQTYKFFQGNHTSHPAMAGRSVAVPAHTDSAVTVTIGYRFLHDRVQQAAYALIPDSQKQATHWQIGQLLLNNLSPQEQDERRFELVNQLNLGRTDVLSLSQQRDLARLNQQAGKKARLSAAYQAAFAYYEIGASLLSQTAWHTDYELIYQLHRDGAEAAYISGQYEQAEALYAITLAQARTPLDQATIHRIQMTQYQLQGRFAEAIAIQRQSLDLLGWTVPERPEQIEAELDTQIETITQFLEHHTISSILERPTVKQANIDEMMRILQILFYAAFLDGQRCLSFLAAAKMTTLSLQYGNSDMSPFGYVGYSMVVNILLKNAALACQFGEMAVTLCEQFDNPDIRGMTNFLFASDVHSWSRPIRAADTYYDNAYKYGMEAGDWLSVCFAIMQSGSDRLIYGKNLNDLYEIVSAHADFLCRIKSLENLDNFKASVIQPIRHLLGLTQSSATFDDDEFCEADHIARYQDNGFVIAWFYAAKIRHAVLFNQQDRYLDLIPCLGVIQEALPTHTKVPSSVFFVILMYLALVERTEDEQRCQDYWQAIGTLEAQLMRWQQDCPENLRHKHLLVQAEIARLQQRSADAMDYYDQAIAAAHAQGYGYEAGLANELAAQFYLNWGKNKVAAGYLQEAYYDYARWGAKAKVTQLTQTHPQLLAIVHQASALPITVLETVPEYMSRSTSNDTTDWLDFAGVVQAAQAISQEMELEQLVQQLMNIAIAQAGAQTGQLILCHAQQWTLTARATSDQYERLNISLDQALTLPQSLVYSVIRTQDIAVFANVSTASQFAGDPYVMAQSPQSVLCLPLNRQGQTVGILYLENNVTVDAFTGDHIEILQLLASQAAISLENARLYQQTAAYSHTLEAEVQQQTAALQDKATALEQALHQLQHTNLELERVTRLKDEFLANMSHELRTPLNAILGMTEGLQEQVFGDISDRQSQVLQTIDRSGHHLLELINDILDIAKIESGQLELDLAPTALAPLCQTSLTFVKQQAFKKRIQLDTQLPTALPELVIDERRIRQVLINLLNNAVKFTPEGGRITLSVGPVSPGPPEGPPLASLRIAVTDTGIGIAPEHLNRLFQPFIQIDSALNRQYTGTGLGLSLVKRIIELHGGQVGVTSTVGEGSCFFFEFPDAAIATVPTRSDLSQRPSPAPPVESQPEHPPLILMAEDNEANIMTLTSYLEAKGYRTIVANTGQAAIELAQATPPDLILMDIQMPGMDGIEATQQLRRLPQFTHTPIVALTALAMAGDRERCLAAGANDYLSKPVKLKELTTTIAQLLTP